MAKIIVFDQVNYGSEGLIPLVRGDDWSLKGKIVSRYAGFEVPVSLAGGAATAFFPDTTGAPIPADVITFDDPAKGLFTITASASGTTPSVELSENGIAPYIIFEKDGRTQTFTTEDEPIQVRDRDFIAG